MREAVIFVLGALGWMAISSASADEGPQECTAISVPESVNLPIRAAGTLMQPPTELSAVYKELLNTVQLPPGFHAVGGGSGMVIACTGAAPSR